MTNIKYYAVRKGKKIGVFTDWNECKEATAGYSGAEYKSFPSRELAEEFISQRKTVQEENKKYEYEIYTDGSYDKRTDRFSYGILVLKNDQIIDEFGGVGFNKEFNSANNVAGEIFGAINSIRWCIKNKIKEACLFYDYEGIEKWFNGSWSACSKIAILYKKFKEEEFEKNSFLLHFQKVKGHSNNKYNDAVDLIAKKQLGL